MNKQEKNTLEIIGHLTDLRARVDTQATGFRHDPETAKEYKEQSAQITYHIDGLRTSLEKQKQLDAMVQSGAVIQMDFETVAAIASERQDKCPNLMLAERAKQLESDILALPLPEFDDFMEHLKKVGTARHGQFFGMDIR